MPQVVRKDSFGPGAMGLPVVYRAGVPQAVVRSLGPHSPPRATENDEPAPEVPAAKERVSEAIARNRKLAKMLGNAGPAAPPPPPQPPTRPRANSLPSVDSDAPDVPDDDDALAAQQQHDEAAQRAAVPVGAAVGNDLSKVSKFFGTHISPGTATALKSARGRASQEVPPLASSPAAPEGVSGKMLPAELVQMTRHRRASSTSEEPTWVRAPRAFTPQRLASSESVVPARAADGLEGPVSSGRLMLTMWRPSGVKSGCKFYFEVLIDYQVLYRSPMLERKKPEWCCNVCVDATLDSLLLVRLVRVVKTKEVADAVHVKLLHLPLAAETATVLVFPEGEHLQVFLLALDFGMPPVALPEADSEEVPLEEPNVLDVTVTTLCDVRVGDDALRRHLTVQAVYADQ